jgi:hypothetical protein
LQLGPIGEELVPKQRYGLSIVVAFYRVALNLLAHLPHLSHRRPTWYIEGIGERQQRQDRREKKRKPHVGVHLVLIQLRGTERKEEPS